MNSNQDRHSLTDAHVEIIKLGEALTKDYFYIPVISYEDEYVEPYRLFYELQDGSLVDNAYASKVNAGETLWHAVRRDLGKDFAYPKDHTIMIDSVRLNDGDYDKQGNYLSRVVVGIVVVKFDASLVKPLGIKLAWEDELPENSKLRFTRL